MARVMATIRYLLRTKRVMMTVKASVRSRLELKEQQNHMELGFCLRLTVGWNLN